MYYGLHVEAAGEHRRGVDGVMLCLYSLYDFRTDLWYYTERTDAGILSAYWGIDPLQVPYLAYLIALIWVLVSLSCMYRAMRAVALNRGL